MNPLRLFLAVDLPAPAKDICRHLVGRLKEAGADVKWVERDNFHITLKFLGDVPEGRVAEVTGACEAVCLGRPGFPFSLDGLGAFPSMSAPRILWVGAAATGAPFKELARGLETALGRLGFKKEERPFHPHVTIGRVRSPRNRVALLEALQKEKNALTLPGLRARGVTLFESALSPHGAVYTVRAALPFKT